MSLFEKEIIFLDCQTTGIRPPRAKMIELAWARAAGESGEPQPVQSALLRVPDDHKIPSMVLQMTGLTEGEIRAGKTVNEIAEAFDKTISQLDGEPLLIAHYCQFERPFVEDLFRECLDKELRGQWLCLNKLSKILFPDLPSRNIKALAGFFGLPLKEANRAPAHVEATQRIWNALSLELEKRGITTKEEMFQLFTAPPTLAPKNSPKKKQTYHYRMDRLKRLQLPDEPGVYKMLSEDRQVLYVGKATSLKSRVNSYFRGVKNRDKRKLELMAQVWDIETISCPSPLQAALLESDEIKRLNPPYNIALKVGWRPIFYFSRDFLSCSKRKDNFYPLGPFKSASRLEQAMYLWEFFKTGRMDFVFYDPIPIEVSTAGFFLFLEGEQRSLDSFRSLRDLLALGMRIYRRQRRDKKRSVGEIKTEDPIECEEELTPQDVAGKCQRVLAGAAASLYRARRLNQLLYANVAKLHLYAGRIVNEEEWNLKMKEPRPHTLIDAAAYDRLSIVLSSLPSPTPGE